MASQNLESLSQSGYRQFKIYAANPQANIILFTSLKTFDNVKYYNPVRATV